MYQPVTNRPSPQVRLLQGLTLFLLALCFSSSTLEAKSPSKGPDDRLIVLGFDGGDGRTVEEMMDAGELPNMQRLREQGTFARLGTSVPNESPTSWASLNTGQNPGKNGVSGFIKRIYSRDNPTAFFGFIDPSDTRAIEDYENVPIPIWDPMMMAGVAGGGAFVVFMIVFAGLLRIKLIVSLILSILMGGVGAYAGMYARGMMPSEISRTSNVNEVRNFWDYAGDAGVESIVLEAAQAWDMPTPDGTRVLAGLGVPDARGEIGTWFIYSDDEEFTERPPKFEKSSTAGLKFRVDWTGDRIETELYGPKNFWKTDKLKFEIADIEEKHSDPSTTYKDSMELNARAAELEDQLKVAKSERVTVPLIIEKRGDDKVAVIMDGVEQVLAEGDWSDFYHLSFVLNPLLKVKAVTRCKIISLGDTFKMFINTLDLDPESPPFWQPISQPHGFSKELVETSHGTFETYGWACTTMPFKDGEISSDTLLEDIEFTMKWRERMTYAQLERGDWRMLMSVFSTTDRVQHMMYQYYDELHPMYDAEEANREVTFFGKQVALKDVIPEIYRQADRIVGNVMDKHLGANDTLLICADHGFQTFRRQVSINNWLIDNGYMVLKPTVTKNQTKGFAAVDWSKTKAYALGLGFIYINEKGREAKGIVDPADKMAVLKSIQADLLKARDEEKGVNTVLESYLLSEEHSGEHMDIGADLVLGFAPGYRVAWTTTGGGIRLVEDDYGNVVPGEIYTDNTSPWSGGHPSVARDEVRGIFFSNRKVTMPEGGPNLLHIAPTALSILGVPIPAEMDLAPLKIEGL
ncbi:MAG: putative AlkP superfamily phosphohydrolase/phosphomutase [Planctomycetota bacterium]|jgi:predicted AlkP superfamily phosphohydrolase/phosphomutase